MSRDSAILAMVGSVSAITLAWPAVAQSLDPGQSLGIPTNIDPNMVGMLVCIYVIRDMYVKQTRMMEILVDRKSKLIERLIPEMKTDEEK